MTFAPDLFLHPLTRRLVEGFIAHPNHGLMLHGESGCGTGTLALAVADAIGSKSDNLTITALDDKDISIEQIRDLYTESRSVRETMRCIVIDDADRMSHAAQNAFLKLLEEPPRQVIFIMVVHDTAQILPTIRSRVQMIEVRKLPETTSLSLINSLTPDQTRQAQVMFLAKGKPALMKVLLTDEKYFAAASETARAARIFLQSGPYERLMIASSYTGSRQDAAGFIATLGLLAYHIHTSTPGVLMADSLDSIVDALDNVASNANARLQLAYLALSL